MAAEIAEPYPIREPYYPGEWSGPDDPCFDEPYDPDDEAGEEPDMETVGDIVQELLKHDQQALIRGGSWPFYSRFKAIEITNACGPDVVALKL